MRACFLTVLVTAISAINLVSCGYSLGGNRPVEMDDVTTVYIEMPKNNTQYSRLEALLANYLSDSLISDARYQQASFQKADVKLSTRITSVSYSQIRPFRTNVLKAEEMQMVVAVQWSITSLKRDGSKRLMEGNEKSKTRFFLSDNLQTAQQNGFPDALRRVSRQIVSQFSNEY